MSSGGVFLGSTTNNVAEYYTIIGILIEASSLGISRIIINLDSQLMVCQLNKVYTIHNPILLHLHLRVRHLETMFEFTQYRHIPRELNTTLDSLENYILDQYIAHR